MQLCESFPLLLQCLVMSPLSALSLSLSFFSLCLLFPYSLTAFNYPGCSHNGLEDGHEVLLTFCFFSSFLSSLPFPSISCVFVFVCLVFFPPLSFLFICCRLTIVAVVSLSGLWVCNFWNKHRCWSCTREIKWYNRGGTQNRGALIIFLLVSIHACCLLPDYRTLHLFVCVHTGVCVCIEVTKCP